MKSCKYSNKTEKNKLSFSSVAHAALDLRNRKEA